MFILKRKGLLGIVVLAALALLITYTTQAAPATPPPIDETKAVLKAVGEPKGILMTPSSEEMNTKEVLEKKSPLLAAWFPGWRFFSVKRDYDTLTCGATDYRTAAIDPRGKIHEVQPGPFMSQHRHLITNEKMALAVMRVYVALRPRPSPILETSFSNCRDRNNQEKSSNGRSPVQVNKTEKGYTLHLLLVDDPERFELTELTLSLGFAGTVEAKEAWYCARTNPQPCD